MSANVEISKRLVLINSASSFLGKLLNAAVLIWLQQYLLRRITPEEYSLYPIVMAVMVFVPLLTTVLTAGQGRFVVEAYAKGDERRITQITSTMYVLSLLVSSALLPAGWLFSWYIDHILTIAPDRLWDARIMMGLLFLMTAIQLPLAPFTVGLYVRQRFVLWNSILFGQECLRTVVLCVLLFAFSTRVLWIVTATVIANLCGLWMALFFSRRLVPGLRFRRSEVRWRAVKELTSFGFWNLVAQVADMIRTSADPLILNRLGTAIDVTCFHLGSLALQLIQQGSYVVSAPLQPVLTVMHATADKDGLRSAYLRGGRYALWAALLMAVPLVAYRNELLRLYLGDRAETYVTAATVMALLLAAFPIAYGNVMLPKIAHAAAEIRPLAVRVLLMQLLNLALTLYLVGVRGMGAMGSAGATFIVITFIYPVLNWPLGLRLADVTWGRWLRETMWPGFVPALGGTVVWMGMLLIRPPHTWVELGACTAAGGLCYMVILMGFCLQPADRRDLACIAAKIRGLFAFGRPD